MSGSDITHSVSLQRLKLFQQERKSIDLFHLIRVSVFGFMARCKVDYFIKFIERILMNNTFSVQSKNQNSLNIKTKNFKNNYSNSEDRMRSTSSLQHLASKIYQEPSKKQQPKPSNSIVGIVGDKSNPENLLSFMAKSALSGLNQRASQITNYAELNTELLRQKKELEELIKQLKERIAKEKRGSNQATISGKQALNKYEKTCGRFREAHQKSERLNREINLVKAEVNALKKDNEELRKKNNAKSEGIKCETKNCSDLQTQVRNLKIELSNQEKERNQVKDKLIKAQKMMESQSILSKELESDRAKVLLAINQYVGKNKL